MLFSGSRPAPIQSATFSYAYVVSWLGVGVVAGQRVPVGDEVEAVVLVLQRHPVAEGADEVAEVQPSGRPHARDDPRPSGLSSCGVITAATTDSNLKGGTTR